MEDERLNMPKNKRIRIARTAHCLNVNINSGEKKNQTHIHRDTVTYSFTPFTAETGNAFMLLSLLSLSLNIRFFFSFVRAVGASFLLLVYEWSQYDL